ncbi:MAG: DUF433 domain-containing protein [Candidatus Hydrogenedentes bacterium]|nr:DUF433 domain-containing protein [Candidatus Hydrogenedentota bacterium]
MAMSPDKIVSAHPGITLADVHAALAYYFDHTDEIRQFMRDDDTFAESLRGETPSKLIRKLVSGD